MEKHRNITLERLGKFTQEVLFGNVNLRSVLTKKKTQDGINLSVYQVPDLKRMWVRTGRDTDQQRTRSFGALHAKPLASPLFLFSTFAEATNPSNVYKPAKVGDVYGPSWATFWFKVSLTVPTDWSNEECINFTWDVGGAESMIWTTEGQVVTGLTGGRDGNRRADWNIKGIATPGKVGFV